MASLYCNHLVTFATQRAINADRGLMEMHRHAIVYQMADMLLPIGDVCRSPWPPKSKTPDKINFILCPIYFLDKNKSEDKFYFLSVVKTTWNKVIFILYSTLNSLRPSDVIWQHRSGSTLAQVMTCCPTAPSHHRNHHWGPLALSWGQIHHNSMGYCKKDVTPLLMHWSYVFLAITHRTHFKLFEHYICENTATSPRDQWVMIRIWDDILYSLSIAKTIWDKV